MPSLVEGHSAEGRRAGMQSRAQGRTAGWCERQGRR